MILVSNETLSSSINSLIIESYYVIQWENSNVICVVPQSSIFKSPDFIEINDICFIETEGKYRRGRIQFKGFIISIDYLSKRKFSFIFRFKRRMSKY